MRYSIRFGAALPRHRLDERRGMRVEAPTLAPLIPEGPRKAKEPPMAKGQKRSSKEIRKPKKEAKKVIAAKPSSKGSSPR